MVRFLFFFYLAFCLFSCKGDLQEYVKAQKSSIRIHILPTKPDIDILFLRSISSLDVSDEKMKQTIEEVKLRHARWFDLRLKAILQRDGFAIVSKERANIILDPSIVDMAEIRTRKFIEGLSIGLVLGLLIGEATGEPEVGLAVFLWEVVEEIIIVYLLKTTLMVSTIDLKILDPEGKELDQTEFTSYSSSNYRNTLPESTRDLRENKVRGSLLNNAEGISTYLQKLAKER